MTNQLHQVTAPGHPRIRLHWLAVAFFILSPLLIVFGGLTAMGTTLLTFDLAKTPTMLGTVMFLVGLATLMVAFVLVGVRSAAQQQLDVLLARHR
ncbi:hypothetical protein C5B85_07960 [Pseudoclavibacter sp. AY1F1]|uniref:hypothetical protein n=1 Tax=Pseudoclavibacter sp. AY1F1 TaxID=2080583 RepID=UPI000CE8B824|nr:hypothetical protein [Pseudoclavibacter sp. AY1F1]PPF45493.1 hypothetical protein C5B85_07960 [Pseudoclavibacter sp. AY1F1]